MSYVSHVQCHMFNQDMNIKLIHNQKVKDLCVLVRCSPVAFEAATQWWRAAAARLSLPAVWLKQCLGFLKESAVSPVDWTLQLCEDKNKKLSE